MCVCVCICIVSHKQPAFLNVSYRIIIQKRVSNKKCIFQQHTIPAPKSSRVNTPIQKHSTSLSISDVPKIKDECRRA